MLGFGVEDRRETSQLRGIRGCFSCAMDVFLCVFVCLPFSVLGTLGGGTTIDTRTPVHPYTHTPIHLNTRTPNHPCHYLISPHLNSHLQHTVHRFTLFLADSSDSLGKLIKSWLKKLSGFTVPLEFCSLFFISLDIFALLLTF